MPRVKGTANKRDNGINNDPKQRKFPRRTHIARERPSLGSAKEKRQSSLTQLAFVSTPGTSPEQPEVYTDYEDSDFEEPRPKKKQRVSFAGDEKPRKASNKKGTERKLEKGQDTLTQLCNWVPSSAQRGDEIEDDSDDPGFNIYNDDGRERFAAMIGEEQKQRRRRLPWFADNNNETTKETRGPANVTSGRRYNLRSPEKGAEAVDDSGYISQSTPSKETPVRRYNTRGSSAKMEPTAPVDLSAHSIAIRDFHTTPKKRARLQEIPSSNTPPSAKVVSQHAQLSDKRAAMLQQSPLKPVNRSPLEEKSVNVQSAKWNPGSPKSQNPAMKMLQKVRQRKMAALHNTAAENHQPEVPAVDNATVPNAEPAAKQAMPAPPPPPRKLKRTATVRDSQADELGILIEATAPAPMQPPPRKLKRTNTVQDSQCEDLDLSSPIYRTTSGESLEAILETDPQNDEDYDHDEDYETEQYTYDPVSAALDRDAARYGMTQTQAPATLAKNNTADDDNSAGDDLNVDMIPDSDDEDEEILALSPVHHAKQASQELPSSDFAGPLPSVTETQAPQAINPLSDSAAAPGSSSPPSSPPAFHLRPSQVSTVMPTQASPYQQLAGVADVGEEHYSPPTSPQQSIHDVPTQEARLAALNTQPGRLLLPPESQTHTQAQSTFSSSPLPLPPWSSPDRARWVETRTQTQKRGERAAGGESGWEPLTDFSLPPPPPLPSSSVVRSSSPGNAGQ